MPDLDPKLASGLQNLHVEPAVNPDLRVTPEPRFGRPQPDPLTVLQQTIATLQATVAALQASLGALQTANGDLRDQVTTLTTDMQVVQLVEQSLVSSVNTVKPQLAKLEADYAAHCHPLPFGYESLPFLLNTPNDNKVSFLVPYVWEGQNQNWTDSQRQQDAQKVGSQTGGPAPKPA